MALCVPYRYLIAASSTLGLAIIISMRASFVLVITHATVSTSSVDGSQANIFPHCNVPNTSRDYESDYPASINMGFHTALFVGMFISMVSGGYITSRFPADRITGIGLFLSSCLFLTIPAVFRVTSVGVYIIRFIQGVLEGVCQPALFALIASWALKRDKSTLLSISCLGLYFSPAVSNIFVGACLCYISWDSAIYIMGAVGVLWCLFWTKFAYALPEECPYLNKDALLLHSSEGENVIKGSKSLAKNIPWKAILTSKPVWAIWLCNFLKNFVTATLVTLQPQFFKDVFGIRTADIGLLLSFPFIVNSILVFASSCAVDRIVNSQYLSLTAVRKLMQCVGATCESFFFICMIYASSWQMSFVFLTIAYAFGGITFSGYSCNPLDLSPQYSGAVSAVVMTGIIGSAASTLIASLIPGRNSTRENWAIVFWLEAALSGVAAIVYFFFATAEKQPWGNDCEILVPTTETSLDDPTEHEKMPLRNGILKEVNGKCYTTS